MSYSLQTEPCLTYYKQNRVLLTTNRGVSYLLHVPILCHWREARPHPRPRPPSLPPQTEAVEVVFEKVKEDKKNKMKYKNNKGKFDI